MAICAYCREDQPATREHVIPAFLYAFQKQFAESVVGWNEVANRMVGGEARVKDVCGNCNNGPLSQLDAYGKDLLTDSGLLVRNYTKRTLTLAYNYSLLLRWLLKISFNSSRTDGAHASIFEDHIPFILGLAPPPPRYRVVCLLSLAAPEVLRNHLSPPAAMVKLANGSGYVNPFFVRISYGRSNERFVHRVNIFGPAIFQLIMFNPGVRPGHAASDIRSLLKVKPAGVELSEKRPVVCVDARGPTWLDIFGPQIARANAVQGDLS